MTLILQNLIAALREELQQYGEMLARLDDQQDLVMQRDASRLLQSVTAIEEQGLVIRRARESREAFQCELSGLLGLPDDSGFSQILPLLPADLQPLTQALVQENNDLLHRVQARARQNHLLLRQSLDLMQRFMNNLFPSHEPKIYNGGGQRYHKPVPAVSLYEAVG